MNKKRSTQLNTIWTKGSQTTLPSFQIKVEYFMHKNKTFLTKLFTRLYQKIPQLQNIALPDPYRVYRDIPMEIAIYDTKGRYKFVNDSYAGDDKTRDRLLGKTDDFYAEWQGINSDSLQKRKQYFQQILEEKDICQKG